MHGYNADYDFGEDHCLQYRGSHSIEDSDLVLANPLIWGPPVLEINMLRDKEWIGASIMDFFLLHHWLQVHKDALMYFLDSTFSFTCYKEPPTTNEIAQF